MLREARHDLTATASAMQRSVMKQTNKYTAVPTCGSSDCVLGVGGRLCCSGCNACTGSLQHVFCPLLLLNENLLRQRLCLVPKQKYITTVDSIQVLGDTVHVPVVSSADDLVLQMQPAIWHELEGQSNQTAHHSSHILHKPPHEQCLSTAMATTSRLCINEC